MRWGKSEATGFMVLRDRRCKPCKREEERAAYEANPTPILERNARYREANKESVAASKKRWAQSAPVKAKAATPEGKLTQRDYSLRSRYGITLADFDAMLADQGGVCAICLSPDPRDRRGVFHVDHCHTSGAVRGLLCYPCNVSLGGFSDDPVRLQSAIDYLARGIQGVS